MIGSASEFFTLSKEYSSGKDIKSSHSLILKTPPQWFSYYNKTRLHNENECFQITKKELATLGIIEDNIKYNSERVKVVSQKKQTELLPLTDRTQFVMYQHMKEVSYYIPNERCLKDCYRISMLTDELYVATVDIPKADKDPSLVTDGKWLKVEVNA